MSEERNSEARNQNQRPGPRKLAEWVSLGISVALIFGLAGYLLMEALKPHPAYVPVKVQPLLKQVREEENRFILPVEVTNQGRRTLRDLTIEIEFRPDGGKPESREVTIDYLGERSKQEIYVYFDRHPRALQVQARPLTYRLD